MRTVHERFIASAAAAAGDEFVFVERVTAQAYGIEPGAIRWGDAAAEVERLRIAYAAAGYGHGHRVGLLLENRPAFLLHWFALNALGVSVVPINAEMRHAEWVYLIGHSEICLAVTLPEKAAGLQAAAREAGVAFATMAADDTLPPRAPAPAPLAGAPTVDSECALLYTSGTTGRPKGCVLTNVYLQESAAYVLQLPPHLAFAIGAERHMNPLPLYHMNAINTLGTAIVTGSCFVLPGRFSASHWWDDIADTRATRFKYLGIMIPALLAQPQADRDRHSGVRLAFGAGVDPVLHERFEQRFGIPLIEVWGMTESGRFMCVDREPRLIHTRACGRPLQGLEARIVDDSGEEVPDGQVGELVVRHSAEAPRYGFFSGYLDDPEATEAAWARGWFHSGDLCTRSADGLFTFVDRKKNIVRRSGENISSAEVEAVLAASPWVRQVAVMAVPDPLRDEEVLACVVLPAGAAPDRSLALALHGFAAEQLAYYKPPGWIYFVDELPVTGTQKVQKHRIFPDGFRAGLPGLYDVREQKRWKK